MKKSNWQSVLTLAVCTLLPVIAAQAKDSVPRPFKMQARSQQVWQLDSTGSPVQRLSAEGWGVATHCGLVTMAMNDWTTGTITAANEDQISFVNIPPSMIVTITGGTGRFDGATGEFTMTILSQEVSIDLVAGTMTIQIAWTAAGTITY